MSSSYPNSLDNLSNPGSGDFLDSGTVPHNVEHANANDSIEAIEGTLGITPQGSSATVRARLDLADSSAATVSSVVTTHTAAIAVNTTNISTALAASTAASSLATSANNASTLAKNQYQIVTSSTRPSSPSNGWSIYETDTFRELVYDGTGWVIMSEPYQITWANPFSGITGGSPAFTGAYHRNDGFCDFQGTLTFTSSPSAMSSVLFTLPFTGRDVKLGQFAICMTDSGNANYVGTNERGTSGIVVYTSNVSGTYIQFTSPTTTVPFTWGSGDFIEISGRYQMASRYS